MMNIAENIEAIRKTTPALVTKVEPTFVASITTKQPVTQREDAPISKTFHTCATPGCGHQTKFLHCYDCNWG